MWHVAYYSLLHGEISGPSFATADAARAWAIANLPFGIVWEVRQTTTAVGLHSLKLGKKAARPNAIKFKLKNYLAGTQAIKVPADFGHEEWTNPPISWGMYGNDKYGDCVIAGGAHEEVLWNRMGGQVIGFNTSDLLKDFSAITGVPPSANVGADMQKAASYRRTVGLLDASGTRRKVAAYLEIQPGNLQELYVAMYLFGAVGVGIQFPTYCFDQFTNHQAWHIVSGGQIDGGHYIPCIALRSNIVCVTWGRFQAMRSSFFSAYCDEAVAYVSQDALTAGKSPEGFDYATLINDLQALNG